MSRNSPTFLKPLLLAACLATAMPMVAIAADAPAYELGIVGRNAADGVELLAITPGSPAERIGLRAGDHIVSVNGEQLGGIRNPLQALQQSIDDQGGNASIVVMRDGALVSVVDQAKIVASTGNRSTGCGYVSDREGVVPRSKQIFYAEITQIDGRSTPFGNNRHEVPAGTHVLVVREFIDRSRLTGPEIMRIDRMKQRLQARAYKTVLVDVRPNTSYRIGARLLKDKLDPASIHDNAYWEPVVWSSVAEQCR